jgi:dihydrofolate synthase/folylpolyglutamate synthase
MEYTEALRYLDSLADEWVSRQGMAVRSEDYIPRMKSLLARLGNPHLCAPIVHVAGSKGKGSTSVMIAAGLTSAGLHTGLYVQPHLHTVRERISIDHTLIDKDEFGRLVGEVRAHVDAENADDKHGRVTWFETITAMAFMYFRDQGVDWQVIEVGLGGRLDATNMHEEKAACVLTPISLEHTAILGDTIPKIAMEKAGIIVPGAQVVMAPQRESAADVFRAVCAERGAFLHEVASECALAPGRTSSDGQDFKIRTPNGTYSLRIPLLGRHQLDNAATAILTLETLRSQGVEWSEVTLRQGLAAVRWPARCEVLRRRPLIMVDGAHNGDSARRLRETLQTYLGVSSALFVVGVLDDKDLDAIARETAPIAASVIATGPKTARARSAHEVAGAYAELGVPTQIRETVDQAVEAALSMVTPDQAVCVFGSLYTAAEAREYLLGLEPEPA